MEKKNKSNKRVLTGTVVSNAMINTIVVKVVTKKMHPIYKKVIKSWKKYMAETKGVTYEVGENITIQESRMLSKNKKWVVLAK